MNRARSRERCKPDVEGTILSKVVPAVNEKNTYYYQNEVKSSRKKTTISVLEEGTVSPAPAVTKKNRNKKSKRDGSALEGRFESTVFAAVSDELFNKEQKKKSEPILKGSVLEGSVLEGQVLKGPVLSTVFPSVDEKYTYDGVKPHQAVAMQHSNEKREEGHIKNQDPNNLDDTDRHSFSVKDLINSLVRKVPINYLPVVGTILLLALILGVCVSSDILNNPRAQPLYPQLVRSNILVVGSSGAGKSSFIRNVYGFDRAIFPDSDNAAAPIIQHYTIPDFKFQKNSESIYQLETIMFELKGFGSKVKIDVFHEMRRIANENPFHYVVILLKAKEFNSDVRDSLKDIVTHLRCWGADETNLIVYLTHADSYSQSEQEKLIDVTAEYYRDVFNVRPEVVSFASTEKMADGDREVYSERVKQSKDKYLNRIVERNFKRVNPLIVDDDQMTTDVCVKSRDLLRHKPKLKKSMFTTRKELDF